MVDRRSRCPWATNELAIAYHDEEWGVPVHDDRVLFEFLILEGAQEGLSWDTIWSFIGGKPKRYAGGSCRRGPRVARNPPR